MPREGLIRETVAVPGPRGSLTGELAYGDGVTRGAVLLIGPHPYMGGTMENNVIAHLGGSLANEGWVTMRFNYREVCGDALADSMLAFWRTGRSPHDDALVAEAVAARDWLERHVDGPLVVVGYSFGAHAASEIIDSATSHAVLIAPTVKQHEMSALRSRAIPKLVIYSNDDFATTQLATESWFAELAEPKAKVCLVDCDHFFKGRETVVARQVSTFLKARDLAPELTS